VLELAPQDIAQIPLLHPRQQAADSFGQPRHDGQKSIFFAQPPKSSDRHISFYAGKSATQKFVYLKTPLQSIFFLEPQQCGESAYDA
jgi:hypothetical protein